MAGLNNIREAYEQVYAQVDEALSADERALRRELAADKRASKMEPKVGAKYASSEGQSAARADKKSRGKHIHGTVDEAVYGGEPKKQEEPKDTRMTVTAADKKANTRAWQNYQAGHKGYKAAPHLGEGTMDIKHWEIPQKERDAAKERALAKAKAAREKSSKKMTKEELKLELIAHLRERALDAAEKKEKEHVFKAIKPSKLAKSYPEKSPKEIKSLRYAISTAQAKKNMDTSRSDKRYGVER
jgi:hypothetical protein